MFKFLLAATLLLVLCFAGALTTAMGSFNLDRAIRGVYWSKIGYCPHDKVETWTCDACPKFPGVQNVTTAQDLTHASTGFVAYDKDRNEIVYIFRGTINLVGWIEDFDFPMVAFEPGSGCEGCLVHEGLYHGYLSLSKTLLPALQKLVDAHPDADIYVGGHSMGAGQSTFGFVDVLRKITGSKGIKRCYSFGQPRIVNSAFAKWADSFVEKSGPVASLNEHYYSCNFKDPVCLIAPRKLMKELFHDDFIHQPREVFYPKGGHYPPQSNFRVCNGTYTHEDESCADQINFIQAMLEGPGFYQHTTYLDIGMGCFLEEEDKKSGVSRQQPQIFSELNARRMKKLVMKAKQKKMV